jgi:hypothetical protein
MDWYELKLNSCPPTLKIFGAEINTEFNQKQFSSFEHEMWKDRQAFPLMMDLRFSQ